MTAPQITMLVAMVSYLFAMIGIGIKLSEKNETVSDFYLSGRKLGPFVTAMSAEASDMSSWLLLGLPGVAYLSGMADAAWTAIGLAVGTYLNWLIVAKRLRRYSERTNSITIPEFFSNRFGDRNNILTALAALVIIIFFVPYTASGFAACGKLFNSLFNVDYHAAMLISAVVIIFYTSMGGFLAASTTDFIQSIVMSLALIIILVFGVNKAGGIGAVADNAQNLAGYLSMTATHDAAKGVSSPYGLLTICSTLAWGLGYFGMPHVLLRFMAIEDERKLTLSRRVASVWVVISMSVAILIGIVGLAVSKAEVIETLEGSASETVIIKISTVLANIGIPTAILAGIVLSGILASTMSTSDSQLLAASSSVSNDILMKFLHINIEKKKSILISRLCLVFIAVLGVVFAWNPDSSVFKIVSFAWAGFGAAFGPVMLLGLFWRRMNKFGAGAAMVSGTAMIFIWKFLIRPIGGIVDIYELLPAFLTALVLGVIVSLCTPAPGKDITSVFDEVKSGYPERAPEKKF